MAKIERKSILNFSPFLPLRISIKSINLMNSFLVMLQWSWNSINLNTIFKLVQLLNFTYKRLLNKRYENDITLTGQNSPLNIAILLNL